MKKGFTMIELIFVIVILGVLASVAIPRLAATRDDAEVAKAATNLTTAISDITAYYTAKGDFNSTIKQMTNALDADGKLLIKGNKSCATINTSGGGKQTAATVPGGNPTTDNSAAKITVTWSTGADPVCERLSKLPGIITMCGTTTKQDGQTQTTTTKNCEITIGGSGGIDW